MPPEKEKEIEVKVPAVEEPKGVEVNLKPEAKPDAATEAAARQKAADDAAEKERKRLEYLARKFEQGLKKLDEVAANLKPAAPAKPAEDVDPIEELAQKDWKLGVAEVTKRVLEEKERKDREEAERKSRETKLERARTTVLNRYPNIEDENTEEGRLYVQAMNSMATEDPRIYQNEYGPVLVMHRMEELMRAAGKVPPAYRPQVEQEVDSEVRRRERIGAGSLPAGRQTGSENIVVLTAEEKQICDENSIPYERYASFKRMSGKDFREGVSVK